MSDPPPNTAPLVVNAPVDGSITPPAGKLLLEGFNVSVSGVSPATALVAPAITRPAPATLDRRYFRSANIPISTLRIRPIPVLPMHEVCQERKIPKYLLY